MDWLINTGQLSHFKQQNNKSVTQCSIVQLNGSYRRVLAQTANTYSAGSLVSVAVTVCVRIIEIQ